MATDITQFTQQEIDIERNRRKCLSYQQTHREQYRKYQREYSAATRYELKNVRYRLSLRIGKIEKQLKEYKMQLSAMDEQLAKQANDRSI